MDQQQAPSQNPTPVETSIGAPQEEKSAGALIGSIIIIAIIVVGGVYFWTTQEKPVPPPEPVPLPVESVVITDQATEILLNQGDSDELSDIEADINATNIDNLDSESIDIEKQL